MKTSIPINLPIDLAAGDYVLDLDITLSVDTPASPPPPPANNAPDPPPSGPPANKPPDPPVQPAPPQAAFTATVAGNVVTIHDQTTGATDESFDFGDGHTVTP